MYNVHWIGFDILHSYINQQEARMTKTSLFGPHEMMKVDTDGDFWQEKANKNCMYFFKRFDNSIAD